MTIYGKNKILRFLASVKMGQFGFVPEKMLPTENTSATYQVIIAKALPTH